MSVSQSFDSGKLTIKLTDDLCHHSSITSWNSVACFTRFPQIAQSVIRMDIDCHSNKKQCRTKDKAGI